jgi:hypothetical protein
MILQEGCEARMVHVMLLSGHTMIQSEDEMGLGEFSGDEVEYLVAIETTSTEILRIRSKRN